MRAKVTTAFASMEKFGPIDALLVAKLQQWAPPDDSRVNSVEYYQLLTIAVARRNGWKVILDGCTIK